MCPQKTEKFKFIVIMDAWNRRSFLIDFFELKFYIMLKLIINLHNLPFFSCIDDSKIFCSWTLIRIVNVGLFQYINFQFLKT